MKTDIAIHNIFYGYMFGGLTPQEAANLSEQDLWSARLKFIRTRAQALWKLPYNSKNDLPANVHTLAKNLALRAQLAEGALINGNQLEAFQCGFEVGQLISQIESVLVKYEALKINISQKKPKSEGGKTTASRRKVGAENRAKKAASLWTNDFSDKPERNRTSLIAIRMGCDPRTVARYLKSKGIKKSPC